MLKPISYNTAEGQNRVHSLIRRQLESSGRHEESVREILRRVRSDGDQALVQYGRQFDAPDLEVENLVTAAAEIEEAYARVSQDFLASLRKAADNIETFHARQVPQSWITTRENGVILGQMVRPVDAAGLYVPGGKGGETPLVSSVLMNAIPARIAGVGRIVLATPPRHDGTVNPHLLVAAAEAGVSEIYKMGSAWAIGAMAFGTETVRQVDVVVGPGNIYVTLAKKMVAGIVGIDMVAGPSEVVVLADETARASYMAADLLSQAEHDPLATAVLITTSSRLAEDVARELARQVEGLARKEAAAQSLEDNGLLLVVDSTDTAIAVANRIGPEHLEIVTADAWGLLPKIRHAGAVFLGPYTPEPVGDYIAGPNHVLPTMGTARFSSALGVETFLKRSSLLAYTRTAFQEEAEDIIRLAETEGLGAHAQAVRIRMA